MATNITPIDPDELIGKGVTGLPDSPELSTLAMQQKFDELSIDIIIPHINGMCTEINAAVDGVALDLLDEISRAQNAEAGLRRDLNDEIYRAQEAERAEAERATGAENAITSRIDDLGLSVVNGKLCITYNE